MNSPSQPSDRLRDILHRARERYAAVAAAPPVPQPAQGEATVAALLDKSQPLPDPRALSRLYREQALAELPDESDETESAATATSGALPAAPGPAAEQPPPSGGVTSQPPMSPAEMRAVMKSLQEQFSTSTYRVYELPKAPPDDFGAVQLPEQEEQKRQQLEETLEQLAGDTRRSNLAYLVGAVLVVVVIGTFIYLATSGPLKAPVPSPTPSLSLSAKP